MILAVFLCLWGCIDPYTPEIKETKEMMVINGRITDQEGFQYVEVSRTSPLNNGLHSSAVRGCTVEVEDNNGKIYSFEESGEGVYACWMEQADLTPGSEYRLRVSTPEGKIYRSGFEKLLPCPPIEEIPWEVQKTETSNPNFSYNGVQFYVSTDASGDYAKNYLWELEETWRYHSTYWVMDYYDSLRRFDGDPAVGIIILSDPIASDSLATCYRTLTIPHIYTYSAKNLAADHLRRIPLNYVSDRSSRLSSRYSLLVRQYSLTDRAYDFWKTLEGQSKETGGLYGTQPVMINGNISSEDNPGETVLGLFFATAMMEKRIYMWPNLKTKKPYCTPYGLEMDELREFLSHFRPEELPVYLIRTSDTLVDYAEQECFNCRLQGGTTERPDFWED